MKYELALVVVELAVGALHLRAQDADPGEARGREPGRLELEETPVPDDDVRLGDPRGEEPRDDGVHDLRLGREDGLPDGVDLDADDVLRPDEFPPGLAQVLFPGELGHAGAHFLAHPDPVDLLPDGVRPGLHPDHLAGVFPGERALDLGDLADLVDIGLNLRRRGSRGLLLLDLLLGDQARGEGRPGRDHSRGGEKLPA